MEMHSKCLEIYGKIGFINIIFLIHFYIKYIVYKIHHYTVIICYNFKTLYVKLYVIYKNVKIVRRIKILYLLGIKTLIHEGINEVDYKYLKF